VGGVLSDIVGDDKDTGDEDSEDDEGEGNQMIEFGYRRGEYRPDVHTCIHTYSSCS